MRAKGPVTDRFTQGWVRATGTNVTFEDHPWLVGPFGHVRGIGASFFDDLTAEREDLELLESARGLMPQFAKLRSPSFDPDRCDPEVARFYEQTSSYDLQLWSEWSAPFRPFGGAVATLFSRRLQQLNLPLSPLESSRGVDSRIVWVRRHGETSPQYAGWVRLSRKSGRALFVGAYSLAAVPGHDGLCVKVVFPLPNGCATVLLRPANGPEGAFELVSEGQGFGDPGFYFVVDDGQGRGVVRYVRSFKEQLLLYREGDKLQADHIFRLFGARALHLHYVLEPNVASGE